MTDILTATQRKLNITLRFRATYQQPGANRRRLLLISISVVINSGKSEECVVFDFD